jgi:hypothetical protein
MINAQAPFGHQFLQIAVGEANRRYHLTHSMMIWASKWRPRNKASRELCITFTVSDLTRRRLRQIREWNRIYQAA